MPFEVTIQTETFDQAAESAIAGRLAALRFTQRSRAANAGFTSTRSSDEQTMLEDAATMIGALQARGITVTKYSLDATAP
jgi:isoaspartyl peptidase/L-asparaginase-like protein (Ntn-hydrolase superfamily)